MRTHRAVGLFAVIYAVLLLAGCATSGNDRNTEKDNAAISSGSGMFQEGESGTLVINNQASFDVIIFAGNVMQNNVLGGIRAGKSRTFDINSLNLPAKNGCFLIRAASFETYNEKNLTVTESDVLYSELVVYDLNNPKDRINLNIFAGINENQSECVYVSNDSEFVLELHIDNPTGEKIATLAPLQRNKQIFLSPLPQGMPYQFYPAYVYVDPVSNEVKRFAHGAGDRFGGQRRIPEAGWSSPMIFEGFSYTSAISYQVGFLRLKNDTNESLNFMNGTQWLPDQKGLRLVGPGQIATFELAAISGNDGQVYTNLQMEFDSTKNLRINRLVVRPGVVYDIVISTQNGDYTYDVRETSYKDKLEDMRMSLFLED